MAVSVTLRNTFLEVADAPIKRRARASSSPLMEDSCEETVVPSDDSGESCDERAEPLRKEMPCPRSNVWGSSPAIGAARSPLLCPWPSTPEFMPTYKCSEPMLPLPPCAEDALLPPSFGSPEEMEAAMWDLAWCQMYWSENGLFDSQSLQDPDALEEHAGSASWMQESCTDSVWVDELWMDSPQDKAAILPRRSKQAEAESDAPRTTVMLKNMPNNQTRKMLLELLDREGFALGYDFVYLPYDFKTGASLGYGFVNFLTPEIALEAFEKFDGYSRWTIPSRKVCGVGWSEPHQGLEAHIERYRDSPVMHHDVPDKFKPLILKNGTSVPFPPPTKKLRAPRLRGLTPCE